MLINQYAIYRVDLNKKGSQLKHMPYQEVRIKKLQIRVDSYKQIHLDKMDPADTVMSIFNRTRVFTEVSDVLVVYKEGELSCYYVDEERPWRITGFIQLNPTGAVISMDTKDYEVVGKKGKWKAVDTLIIDGKQYYLLEHQEYGSQVSGVILDSYGKIIADSIGFDENVKRKIREQQPAKEFQTTDKKSWNERLLPYQKFFVNGTHERNCESGTEKSYDSIDGCVNNLKDSGISSADHRGQATTKPKKRTSVIKKLHEKQIAIAKKNGKPVPKYLEQQMVQERARRQ